MDRQETITDLLVGNFLVAGHNPAQDLLPVQGVVPILVQLIVKPGAGQFLIKCSLKGTFSQFFLLLIMQGNC